MSFSLKKRLPFAPNQLVNMWYRCLNDPKVYFGVFRAFIEENMSVLGRVDIKENRTCIYIAHMYTRKYTRISYSCTL